ncbi:hypothetical protein S7711_10367 [Stachybotrys chartarum IBT 7711]|uniref:Uncharacterized protein n=1 Tax=Stachybotrys chartarum (strain CBS 109288 / IBT 7711) TaxID=1280523 RepID=A0A084ATJ5_STACB|nr:hypothetical protein S7711_10367 [Stachybotrys chartarum IBT 7711]KFA49768.1 hypothetical protein S40293_10497 [Stachybotrys chartarum IBT 40293]KFA77380.1 hypothetical protein S40288_10910 [Stachybotrys chartarum IBT 40288]
MTVRRAITNIDVVFPIKRHARLPRHSRPNFGFRHLDGRTAICRPLHAGIGRDSSAYSFKWVARCGAEVPVGHRDHATCLWASTGNELGTKMSAILRDASGSVGWMGMSVPSALVTSPAQVTSMSHEDATLTLRKAKIQCPLSKQREREGQGRNVR